jgi:hypothetical protein
MSVFLFDFSAGATAWRYTDSDIPESYGGATYSPAALTVSELLTRAEDASAALSVSAPRDFSPVETWLSAPAGARLLLTLRYLDTAGVASPAWAGYVGGADWQDATVALKCLSAGSQLTRPALAVSYGSTCRHAIYSPACGIDPAGHTTASTIARIEGGDPVHTMSSGYDAIPQMVGGIFEAGGQRRTILAASFSSGPGASGARLTLLAPIRGLTAGMACSVARGCRRDFAACKALSNAPRYGGYPHIPLKNPFGAKSLGALNTSSIIL